MNQSQKISLDDLMDFPKGRELAGKVRSGEITLEQVAVAVVKEMKAEHDPAHLLAKALLETQRINNKHTVQGRTDYDPQGSVNWIKTFAENILQQETKRGI